MSSDGCGKVRTAVVTSCSRAGFEKYGLRCLTTLSQFWSTDIGVYLVSEDALELPAGLLGGHRFKFINLAESEYTASFYEKNDTPRARGFVGRYYDFKFDAWKFSKKVFAIELVAAQADVERLVWLDADVFTFAPIPVDFFVNLPPRNFALACLERPGYHSECGFVGYNFDHAATRKFITAFAQLYVTGDVFKLKEWHDSFVFDWLRRELIIPTYKIPHRSRSHPFIHSVLGKFMDHLKGSQRKELGKSSDHPRFGVSRVLQARKPLVAYKERWVAQRRKEKERRLERKKRLQVEKINATSGRNLATKRGHPLPGDAPQSTAVGREGHLSAEQAGSSTSVDPAGSTKLSG